MFRLCPGPLLLVRQPVSSPVVVVVAGVAAGHRPAGLSDQVAVTEVAAGLSYTVTMDNQQQTETTELNIFPTLTLLGVYRTDFINHRSVF